MGSAAGEGKIQKEYQSLPFLFGLLANWCMHISKQLCSFDPFGGGNAACHVPTRNLGRGTKLYLFCLWNSFFLIKGFLGVIVIGNSPLGSYPGILRLSHSVFNIVRYKS